MPKFFLKRWKDEVKQKLQELKKKREDLQVRRDELYQKQHVVETTLSTMASRVTGYNRELFYRKYLEPIAKELSQVEQAIIDTKEDNGEIIYLEHLLDTINAQISRLH